MQRILGQDRALAVLRAALASGRLHHAFVFHGPSGVGKFTTALALARVLLCHDRRREPDGPIVACRVCESCRLFEARVALQAPAHGGRSASVADDAGDGPDDDEMSEDPQRSEDSSDGASASVIAHPDLHVVNKELALFSDDAQVRSRKLMSIPVGVLEEHVIVPAGRKSALGRGKVFILDEAELLSLIGQNKLLKTLEEPPPETRLILVTSNEERLLPTIRSRCQRVGFGPLPVEVVRDWVSRHADRLTPTQAEWLVGFAEGSLGRAELSLGYALHTWAGVVLPALDQFVAGKFDATLGSQMTAMLGEFAERWTKERRNASKEAANRLAATLLLNLITGHARQRLRELAPSGIGGPGVPGVAGSGVPGSGVAGSGVPGVAVPGVGMNPADIEAVLAPWLGVIDATVEAEANLAANVNLSITMDHLALSIFRRARTPAVPAAVSLA